MKLVYVIHFGSVSETSDKIHWFDTALFTRERDHLEVITGSRESLAILFFLLCHWNRSESIFSQINCIYSVTSLNTMNTAIYNELLGNLLNDTLMMSNLCREFSS